METWPLSRRQPAERCRVGGFFCKNLLFTNRFGVRVWRGTTGAAIGFPAANGRPSHPSGRLRVADIRRTHDVFQTRFRSFPGVGNTHRRESHWRKDVPGKHLAIAPCEQQADATGSDCNACQHHISLGVAATVAVERRAETAESGTDGKTKSVA